MMTWTKTFTPKDVYTQKPSIPARKKVVGFRPPEAYDQIVGAPYGQTTTVVDEYNVDNFTNRPRLILADCEPEVDWWE